MKIRVILPADNASFIETIQAEAARCVLKETQIDVVKINGGRDCIESESDAVVNGPGILEQVKQAAADRVDGIFISCFSDPAVAAARECVDVPVVGGFEPAMLTALSLGERIGVVTILPNIAPSLLGLARRYGFDRRLSPPRAVNIRVNDLHNREMLLTALHEEAWDAVYAKREADVIVLGCTGMLAVADALQRELALSTGAHFPVVDPTVAAITWLERAVRLKLRPSRIGLPAM